MTSWSVLHLSPQQVRDATRWARRSSLHEASDDELATLMDEHRDDLLLLQGDLAAGDFSLYNRATLLEGIDFYRHELAEATKLAERRLRARRQGDASGTSTREHWQARFDAMRHADIVDAIQTFGVPLQKQGHEWWACCPFHEERRPSLAVNAEKGVWHCHGCHRGGDLVRFVMERNHLCATEALRFLEEIVTVPGMVA